MNSTTRGEGRRKHQTLRAYEDDTNSEISTALVFLTRSVASCSGADSKLANSRSSNVSQLAISLPIHNVFVSVTFVDSVFAILIT